MTHLSRIVVWIDDDTELKPFRDALVQMGITLFFASSLDDGKQCVESLLSDGKKPDLLIWDASITPSEKVFFRAPNEDDEPPDDLGGILFFNWFRSLFPHTRTMLFTHLQTLIPHQSRPDRGEFAIRKREHLFPETFTSLVKDLLF